ncbi:MAG TPA: class I SAM-dependent methyltransferase [Stellaceae bacterium]|jgi:SAM-dependent methyltransferase|nr:class I SAM-dependent methyltransferase [Stellaceae bacterium]
MTQNIYDDPSFFEGYARLPRSVAGLEAAPEWPALRALLPDMAGLRVLDLGCGYGWFCRWAREAGAAQVFGIDVSEKMLERAAADTAADTNDAAITYARRDMEALDLPPASFDVAYSSLALHYIADLSGLMTQVHRSLAAGGTLVFSAEHPIFTAPAEPKWSEDAAGRSIWPLNRYLEEGPRSTDWLATGVIKQHRTIGTYINTLLAAGFSLTHVEEWGPTAAQIAVQPNWADERQRPPFLIVAARRA